MCIVLIPNMIMNRKQKFYLTATGIGANIIERKFGKAHTLDETTPEQNEKQLNANIQNTQNNTNNRCHDQMLNLYLDSRHTHRHSDLCC